MSTLAKSVLRYPVLQSPPLHFRWSVDVVLPISVAPFATTAKHCQQFEHKFTMDSKIQIYNDITSETCIQDAGRYGRAYGGKKDHVEVDSTRENDKVKTIDGRQER